MRGIDDADLVRLRIPTALRERTREIVAITDGACVACLDEEYAFLCRQLVVRLARKRPSPLVRGSARIWVAGAFEPDLTRGATLEQHPLAWLVEIEGFIVDARMLPADLQDEARRRGLIPDLDGRRAARETRPAYT